MAITLAQSALLSQDDLQRGVIETFVQTSPILDRLPMLQVEGTHFAYNEEATLPGVEFRGVNEGYAESTGTVNQRIENLVILGGDADVDRFIAKTRSDLNDQRSVQTQMKVKAASMLFSDTFFNGDTAVNPKSFDGLRKRLTGAQVLDAGGVEPVSGGYDFFDKLDALVGAVPGINAQNGAIYMNGALLAKVRSGYRRLGGGEMLMSDIVGKTAPAWNGIPMFDAGQRADGTDILPATEIYAVRYGNGEADQAVSGLTNGGVDAYDLGEAHDKPVYRTRVEFYCGIAVFGGRAAARLTNVGA
ncbi:major capsid protein [Streptomyces sp. NPDC006134]|uniref:major capsid protein n=1 Tax=Streptomyces sp. NPDC006134 TaxID=3154467 RepID=UPI0034089DF4